MQRNKDPKLKNRRGHDMSGSFASTSGITGKGIPRPSGDNSIRMTLLLSWTSMGTLPPMSGCLKSLSRLHGD
ncbi:hypothetical protein Fmac_028813 [Flemingia macrophylla]|uniref:Uncharacterized protein n=1 Tax=Flemingia macrophylla TaxID=520843 RepID=A0ABD1L8L1_9FABA